MAHPFILYGDSPSLPSGLGRILRDLATRCFVHEAKLGIRVATVGVSEPTGPDWQSWPHFRFQPTYEDQGEYEVARAIKVLQAEGAEDPPIVLVIFDPSRAYALLAARDQGVLPEETRIWGYFPIDGHPYGSVIGGPAGVMIKRVDRCLAYGRYGATILKATREKPVGYLPHGMEPDPWRVATRVEGEDAGFRAWVAEHDYDGEQAPVILGVVATNQWRKDFGLVFEAIHPLQEALKRPVALWIHSDLFTKFWDFGEYARIYKTTPGQVFVSVARGSQAEVLTDAALAYRYQMSDLTLAPGLGEGFGYPIMESLLCGTPVVHVAYAGGIELLPLPQDLVDFTALRAEGIYGILRPVVSVQSLVQRCVTALERQIHPSIYAGAAAWYSWEHVWPAWEQWIRLGVQKISLEARA